MGVKVIIGDMVESFRNNELDSYAHQCNCFCRMGRGIAPLLAKEDPNVRSVDNKTTVGDRDKLGTYSVSETEGRSKVFNIYGQYHWSKYKVAPNRNTDYDALYRGLFAVMETLHKEQYDYDIKRQMTLGLPLIGCGLAGGDWEGVVYPMIKELFERSGIDVTIFVLD